MFHNYIRLFQQKVNVFFNNRIDSFDPSGRWFYLKLHRLQGMTGYPSISPMNGWKNPLTLGLYAAKFYICVVWWFLLGFHKTPIFSKEHVRACIKTILKVRLYRRTSELLTFATYIPSVLRDLEEKLNVVGCCVAIDILVAMPPSPEALVKWSFVEQMSATHHWSGWSYQ